MPIVEVIDGQIVTKTSPKPRGLIELEKRKESLLNVEEVDISEEAEASGSVFGFM